MASDRGAARRGRGAGAWALAVFVVGAPASAQSRFALQADVAPTSLLPGPAGDRFGAGYHLALRAGVRIAGPVGVHVLASYTNWSARDGRVDPNTGATLEHGTLTTFGAGVRVAPALPRRFGHVVVDLDAAFGITGAESDSRLVLAASVGWLLPLHRRLALGPTVRFADVVGIDGDGADAPFVTAGIAIAFLGDDPPEPAPPPPPPAAVHQAPTPAVAALPEAPATRRAAPASPEIPAAVPVVAPPPPAPTAAPEPAAPGALGHTDGGLSHARRHRH